MSGPGKPIDQYVVAQFKISADLDGAYVTDIVAISGNFALNSIPNATLTLASGIEAMSGRPATAHSILKNLRMRAPVKVYLEIEPTDGAFEKQPLEKLLIFEGYYAGFGFQRANDHANYAIHLVHWLDDLNVGSMLSRNWFPAAPFSLVENASSFEISSQLSSPTGGVIVPTFGEEFLQIDKVVKNFWGESLRPILEVIADWPGPGQICEPEPQGTDPNKGRNLIKDTLKKILGDAGEAGALGIGEFFTPLALDVFKKGNLDLSHAMLAVREAVGSSGLASYKYSTFWSKLIGEWGPTFFFAVSPGVDFAQVIPFFAGNREEHVTIEADEYGHASFSGHMAQIIEGIDIFWPAGSGTGMYNTDIKYIPNFCDPLGSFPKRGDRNYRGTVLVKEPPGWLQNYVYLSPNSPETVRITKADGSSKTAAELQRDLKTSNVCDLFAEHWYKTEVLNARYGELSGKLRFDIAPGSTVKIKPPTKNMPALDDTVNMFATVTRVSFVINSERAQAGTAFALAHLRTEQENTNILMTGSTRGETPLYAKKWKGGPLVSNTGGRGARVGR
jgi:hypothetical protein